MSKKLLAASMLPWAVFAHAESTPPSVDDTLVVTASRFEQPVENVVAPITVVTRAEIDQSQAKTLTEVLRRLPGVEMGSNGGIGQNSSLFLRGTNSNHSLILVDGVRMNNSLTAGINLNRFPLNQIERIELIRGSGVAMYGSDAIGGVLNIITRSAPGSDAKKISAGIGSKDYREGNFSVNSDISDKGHLKVAGGFQETEGFNVQPKPGLNDGDKHGFDGNQLMVNYEHAIAEGWVGFTSIRWFENTGQYNHYDYGAMSYKVANSESESTSYTAKLEYNKNGYQSFLIFNYQDDSTVDTLPGQATPISKIGTEQTHIQWANQYQLNENIGFQGGLDWRTEKLDDDSIGWNASIAGERRENIGGYVGATGQYGSLTLLSNIRFDKHDTYDEYTTWSVGSIYQLNENHHLKASFGTSFKAPNYKEFADNPSLNAEEARNIEFGWTGKFNPVTLSVAAYDNKIDNLIIYYAPEYDAFNVDARIRGVEVEALFNTGILAHTLVLEYKDPKDSKGAQLPRRSKENLKWIGEMSVSDFDLSLTYIYVGERPDLSTLDASVDKLDAYSLWDFAATYWVNDELALRGRIDNLFDEKYETAGGYPAPERAYYLSMDYRF
ncbi:TonB-dependent receptor domain-containing protein [Grimontia hollisae]|uniref:TonB-dependent receptor domain-containing protein n=1 Tax=Grimontia hollisae TaxID=673 RepID=UPI00165E4B8A|nr:TonB-dependent receptor [Grimontia hollisae]